MLEFGIISLLGTFNKVWFKIFNFNWKREGINFPTLIFFRFFKPIGFPNLSAIDILD